MRLITNTKNTILSPLSKYAFSIIQQLRETITNTVCNTSKFIQEISSIKIDKEDNFISLDVQDLFTNIPITRAVDIAINKIGYSEAFCESNLTITDLKQMLLLSLNNSYCQFNGRFYRQKRGLPMGNTLSPILADLYMNEYIKQNMEEVNIPSRIWRYVDDILIINKMKEEEVKLYVENLNKIKGKIKFTYEYEKNGIINFLDTTLSKNDDNTVGIRWYRKDTAADRLLHFNSEHNKSVKINIIKNMASKVIETTKNTKNQQDDLNKLKEMLIKSNYPTYIIDKHIKEIMKSTNTKKDNNKKEQENKKDQMKYHITLPFMHGIDVLKRKLEQLKIKVFFSYPNKIHTACTNSIETKSKSNIYQITCNCGAIYNGETKIGINKRISQHQRIIKKNKTTSNSEIIQHYHDKQFECKFDLTKAFIIDNDISWKRRRIKESIYSTINNSINRHDNINELWLPLLYETSSKIKKNITMKGRNNISNVEARR
jgi:hypothetical protein